MRWRFYLLVGQAMLDGFLTGVCLNQVHNTSSLLVRIIYVVSAYGILETRMKEDLAELIAYQRPDRD